MVSASLASTRLHGLGQAEIEHLDNAVRGDRDVGGLEITVDDAPFVGGIERIGNLSREAQDFRDRQAAGVGVGA